MEALAATTFVVLTAVGQPVRTPEDARGGSRLYGHRDVSAHRTGPVGDQHRPGRSSGSAAGGLVG
uniref:Uncharacterized protein n=1 Tax=Verrucosispora sp. MS100047 TaxID=1410949 RepID=A0A097CT83_9ACTN|nr:hypothetical protein VASRM7_624 [Verrucosispora sp. MS100047]